MIATAAVGIIALVVLVVLLNRPNLVLLQDELDPKSVNIITEQLIAAGIPYEVGEDAGSVFVEATLKKDATLALADVGIISNQGMTYADAFNNSIMTSDYEKALKYQLFFEAELARKIEIIESIENAQVTLVIPYRSHTLCPALSIRIVASYSSASYLPLAVLENHSLRLVVNSIKCLSTALCDILSPEWIKARKSRKATSSAPSRSLLQTFAGISVI
jgi:type III secretory pathway lipoprotein EscJ